MAYQTKDGIVTVGASNLRQQKRLWTVLEHPEIRPETPLVASDKYDPAAYSMQFLWENYFRTQESILSSATLHEASRKRW